MFRAIVDDVCAGHLVGRDPLAIRDRMADLGVVLDDRAGVDDGARADACAGLDDRGGQQLR